MYHLLHVQDKLICNGCFTANPMNMDYCVTCEQRLTGENRHLKVSVKQTKGLAIRHKIVYICDTKDKFGKGSIFLYLAILSMGMTIQVASIRTVKGKSCFSSRSKWLPSLVIFGLG